MCNCIVTENQNDGDASDGGTFAGWLVGTPEGITSYWKGDTETVLPTGSTYVVNDDVSLTARYTGLNISLSNDGSNWESLFSNDGKVAQSVILTGRTLYKDGKWNTLGQPDTSRPTG